MDVVEQTIMALRKQGLSTDSLLESAVRAGLAIEKRVTNRLRKKQIKAGQKAAAARGIHIGRPRSFTSAHVEQVGCLHKDGLSERAIALRLGISNGTVHRLIHIGRSQ